MVRAFGIVYGEMHTLRLTRLGRVHTDVSSRMAILEEANVVDGGAPGKCRLLPP